MNFKSEAMHLFADSLLQTRGLAAAGSRIGDKAMALYADKATAQLRQLMLMRDKSLREYMAATHHLAESAFRIDTLSDEELHAYAGKNRYTIAIEMDGETYEVSSRKIRSKPLKPLPRTDRLLRKLRRHPTLRSGASLRIRTAPPKAAQIQKQRTARHKAKLRRPGFLPRTRTGSSGSDTSTETAARF